MPVQELGPQFQFASWRVPQFPRAIEYPLEVMEEIRAFSCNELLQLSHGGDEVGGVLFGTRRDDLIRILTWRPIACEHAHGPGLRLSYNDRMNLAVQFEVARQNPDLKDLRPVGWFMAHSRGSVSLSPSDLEIYNSFCPEQWQVTLVICPKGSGRAQAGFFVREAEDKIMSEASYQCFDLEPLHLGSAPAPRVPDAEPFQLASSTPPAPPDPTASPVPGEQPAPSNPSFASAQLARTSQPPPAAQSLPGAEPAPTIQPVLSGEPAPSAPPVQMVPSANAPVTQALPSPQIEQPVPTVQPVPSGEPAPGAPPAQRMHSASAPAAPLFHPAPMVEPEPIVEPESTLQPVQTALQERRPPAQEVPAPFVPSPSFEMDERVPTHERWLWAVPILLALGIAAFLLYQRRAPSPHDSIALRALAEAQTVQLAWNANSRAIRDSDGAEIEINDGGKSSQVSLTSDQLRQGKMSYLPQSRDVSFEMTVHPANGDPIHDSARLIAPVFTLPPAPTQPPQLLPSNPAPSNPFSSNAPAAPAAGQDALQQQITQLKEDLGKERARADELQNLVRILENRLRIQPDLGKAEPKAH